MNIDTLSIARDLKAIELPAEQAEAIAAAIGRSVTDGAASQADVQLLRADFQVLRADLLASKERLTARIEAASRQTLVWLAGAIFAAAGVLIATIKI